MLKLAATDPDNSFAEYLALETLEAGRKNPDLITRVAEVATIRHFHSFLEPFASRLYKGLPKGDLDGRSAVMDALDNSLRRRRSGLQDEKRRGELGLFLFGA